MQMDMRGRGTLGSLAKEAVTPYQHTVGHKISTKKNTLDRSRETLVTLGIIVFEANLKLDCLDKVALLIAVGFDEKLLDRAPHA